MNSINCDKLLGVSARSLDKFSYLLLAFHASILLILTFSHEPWRDEVSPWLQVKEASWLDIFYRSGLELQSPFFFLILKVLSYINTSYFVYKTFIFSISILSACLLRSLFKEQPFLLITALLNYYLIFEFGAIQRIYSLSIFVLLIFLVKIKKDLQHDSYASNWSMLLLVVFGFVSIWSAYIAVVIFIFLYSKRKLSSNYLHKGLLPLSIVAQVLFLISSRDRDWGVGTSSVSNAISLENTFLILSAPIRAYAPLPSPTLDFWNTNVLLSTEFSVGVLAFTSLFFWLIAFQKLLQSFDFSTFLFLASFAALSCVVGLGKQRHLGQLVVLGFTFFVIKNLTENHKPIFRVVTKRTHIFLVFSLIVNIYATTIAITHEIQNKFSSSIEINSAIRPSDLLIVQDSAQNTFLPSQIEKKSDIFQIFGTSTDSYALLNRTYRTSPDLNLVAKKLSSFCRKKEPDRILLFTDEYTRNQFNFIPSNLLLRTQDAIVGSEGNREVWVLVAGRRNVREFCDLKNLLDFSSKVLTRPVSYGG